MEPTATRVWKRLGREERVAAATHFWREPPEDVVGAALSAVIKARRLRPQVARALPPEEQARALAGVLDPGETVAAALLVSLHLGERRALLATFLDAAGLAHEDGILRDEEGGAPPLGEAGARQGVRALCAAYPREQVETYLNTLWLQDPERWRVLEQAPDC
ncbi:MAG TPA: hypothetical protein VMT87_10245 [Vicinamibacteria bacterium]|nr:hypothetical protein [Vicinamibacteria bacterium]